MNHTARKTRARSSERLAAIAKEITDFPLVFVRNTDRQIVGEVQRIASGKWEARRYGNGYGKNCPTFGDEADAIVFVKEHKQGVCACPQ